MKSEWDFWDDLTTEEKLWWAEKEIKYRKQEEKATQKNREMWMLSIGIFVFIALIVYLFGVFSGGDPMYEPPPKPWWMG